MACYEFETRCAPPLRCVRVCVRVYTRVYERRPESENSVLLTVPFSRHERHARKWQALHATDTLTASSHHVGDATKVSCMNLFIQAGRVVNKGVLFCCLLAVMRISENLNPFPLLSKHICKQMIVVYWQQLRKQ